MRTRVYGSDVLETSQNADEIFGTQPSLTDRIDHYVKIHQENAGFKNLQFSGMPEVGQLRAISSKLDESLTKLRKQPHSVEKMESISTAVGLARDRLKEWRQNIDKSFQPRLQVAKQDIEKNIQKKLEAGDGARRHFLWSQLGQIKDPVVFQNLYHDQDDEVRGAIASMPKMLFSTDFGTKLLPPIDPEVVFKSESERFPELKRTYDIIEKVRNTLDSLGATAEQGLESA